MLKEYPASQHEGEPRRRWFADDYFDIIVWLDQNETLLGFQLCYDKKRNEHSLTWTRSGGFQHDLIDDREESPAKKESPILIADGPFPADKVMERFITDSEGIEQEIRSFIIEKLSAF